MTNCGRIATPVTGKAQVAEVASISAADSEIGDLIGDVMDKVGKDGVITVEEGRGIGFSVEYVEGMEFDRGYISPYFVTNSDRMEASIEDPYIFITDKKLSAGNDVLPLLEKFVQSGQKSLVVIAEDVEGEALAMLVVNKMRGVLKLCRPQGSRLRRSPQRDAAGHGSPNRRSGDFRRVGATPRPSGA